MDVMEAIATRRSVKRFTERVPSRESIERLLTAAAQAPNHRMTQPWRFYVLGARAGRAYAALKAESKAQKVAEAAAAARVREKVERETLAVPAILVVAMVESDDAATREEDRDATFMGIENLLLAAREAGLQGYIHTGRILERPELRALIGAPESERLVAIVDLGEPAETPSPKARIPASELTTWTA